MEGQIIITGLTPQEFEKRMESIIHEILNQHFTPPDPEELHSLEETAQRLRMVRQTLSRLAEKGEIQCIKNGRRRLFTTKAINDYLHRKNNQ